jgi:lipopolysaccharide/colanic/teichoic acid biosynthesis glycosyltransferase
LPSTDNSYEFWKRIIDIFGSTVGLVLFSPIMVVTAIYIKIVSPGPVFADIPPRVGKGRWKFKMYKFRSMIPDAHGYLLRHPDLYEEYKKNSYKLDNDPRIVPGGAFIRKYSIDELPQFINVFKGDMSLVGPRAYYPFELRDQQREFPETKQHVKKLLTVKPGVSGPWQVGGRSDVSFTERTKIDADYASRRSIWYDLYIILKTPCAVVSAKGAG